MNERPCYRIEGSEPGEHPCRICDHAERFHYLWQSKNPRGFHNKWICDRCVNPGDVSIMDSVKLRTTFHQYEPAATIREITEEALTEWAGAWSDPRMRD